MPYVNLTGATYVVGERLYSPGSTEELDAERLKHLRRAAKTFRWLSVTDEPVHAVEAPKPTVELTEVEPALPVQAEDEIAREDEPGPEATRGDRLAELVANDGEKPEAKESKGFDCDECDRTFKNAGGLASHKRFQHAA